MFYYSEIQCFAESVPDFLLFGRTFCQSVYMRIQKNRV